MTVRECDLLIIGAGPSGLSAAINGASEGLKVCMLDAGLAIGGQAKESNRIENYPMPEGFHEGVTGARLISGFIAQALKFSTEILCPTKAAHIACDGQRKIITTDDYNEYVAKSVMLSIGLSYRKHTALNIGPLMGRGVHYGLPSLQASNLHGCTIIVVGGANSAGQAVLRLAQLRNVNVKLVVRKKLADQMSQYLIDRIKNSVNIEVMEGCEVISACGAKHLEAVTLRFADNSTTKIKTQRMFFFIGAIPQTLWLRNLISLDAHNFINTGVDVSVNDRKVLPYETSIAGIFATGDVRNGSTKRIANAIGEGAAGLAAVHKYLSQ